jgi:hypothetical protein
MALWPFNKRKGSRRGVPGRGRQATESLPGPSRAVTEPTTVTTMAPTGAAAPAQGPSKDRSGSKKLRRRDRAYSFSPGRRDTLRAARARKESIPPLPSGPIEIAAYEDYGVKGPVGEAQDDLKNQLPTLHHDNSHNKRRGQPLPRKKSSKRRKEDHNREAELRAMSQPQPTRPVTDNWTKGRSMKKDSKRVRPGLSREWSDVSLPLAESIHSSMSSDSEQMSWKVSALDALAPRPTLRYSSGSAYGLSGGFDPTRTVSQKSKLNEKESLPKATLKGHRRIDSLADDLGASDIRELMERDKRRRERKKEKERERAERRLARRSETQREAEAEAKRNGTPPPQNLERGVMGRDTVGLGLDTTSAVVTSSRRRSPSIDLPRRLDEQPAQREAGVPEQRPRTPSPLDTFHRTDSIPLSPASPVKVPAIEHETTTEPGIATNPLRRSPSPRLMDFVRSKKRRSQSPLPIDQEKADTSERPPPSESTRVASKSSESDSGKQSDSGSSRLWASFLKWGKGGKNRRSSGPSSFSNTSRDSMLASQTSAPPATYVPVRKVSSAIPKRTMSRFREDLPEFPISPPDSRVASPEAEVTANEPLPVITDDMVMRYDTPTSGHRATPTSFHRDEAQISPAPQSMSLASIDSEASWLSGGRRKRASSGFGHQGLLPNYSRHSPSLESEEQDADDDNVADDEFLKTVVDDKLQRKSTGEARPSSDEEDTAASPRWGAVNQTPTVVRHTGRMKSREGLLQSYGDDKELFGDKDSDGTQSDAETPGVPQRALSVDLGKGHIRNFSAGSAKLLDIISRRPSERRSGSDEPATQ